MQNCGHREMQLEKASAINWLFGQDGQVSNFLLSDPEVMMSNPFLTSGIPESCNPHYHLQVQANPKKLYKKNYGRNGINP